MKLPASSILRGLPLLGLMLLCACSHEPPRGHGRDESSPRATEKAVMRALGAVEASDVQRTAVLNAYDRDDAERRRLAAEADDLRRQIDQLSKTQADYLARLEPLVQRQGQELSEQLMIQARFDAAVAATLTPEQLERWNAQFRAAPDRDGGPDGGGGRRRRGPGGGGGPGGGYGESTP
ncbi:MAG: hypothetical protein JWQ90_1211 [Hydrocarboniphaga sp.]|uniref:hypothetical protein n=1 Tax=Hydrocarboniphaga sp. TaxID=2033016 RepID=UPI002620A5FB|nr:hypothetical protein [Hydrocarboniphaga sp.]MDB5968761.1 hypothetical protein [Hydrocarboniphaga sp.]